MMSRKLLLLAVASGLLTSCASNGGGRDVLTIQLQAGQRNAGAVGQATLVEQGDKTGITFFVGGVPAGVVTPVQLLSFIYPGSCAQLGAEPAYALNSTTQTTKTENGWVLSKQIPANLSTLRTGKFAAVIRTSAADQNLQIFCGDIR